MKKLLNDNRVRRMTVDLAVLQHTKRASETIDDLIFHLLNRSHETMIGDITSIGFEMFLGHCAIVQHLSSHGASKQSPNGVK